MLKALATRLPTRSCRKTRIILRSITALTCSAVVGSLTAQTSSQRIAPPGDPSIIAIPTDITAGKIIQDPGGQKLGTIREIVTDFGKASPAFVLVQTDSGITAVPYMALRHLLRDAHLVVNKSVLAAAPRVTIAQVRNQSSDRWKRLADQYWQPRRSGR